MNIKCFFLEPTDQCMESLRRYASGGTCPAGSYHNAVVDTGQREQRGNDACGDRVAHDDPRWPTHCGCGYAFQPGDDWQSRVDALYRRSDTGELVKLSAAPVGAMWFAPWMSDREDYVGPDGQTLVVRLPGRHDWIVDARASNCDSPCRNCGKPYHQHAGGLCAPITPGVKYDRETHAYRDASPHKCWVRHGTAPDVHVDKNGGTCGAGSGSIAVPGYHGFLHNGHLTDC
jgi:hypothetical protein